MFGLNRLWTALATLAARLEEFGATIHEANHAFRNGLHLDAPAPALVEANGDEQPEETATTPRKRKSA